MNPLQTIERDVIFRRWSDVIMHTYLIQAADPKLPAPRLKAVGEAASAQFAALAGAYAGVANKSLETLQIISKPAADGGEAESDAGSLSVTNPGDQPGEKGKPIKPALQIVARGKDLIYKATGLPTGLTLDEAKGEISGAPAKAEERTVKVTVSNASAEATIGFKWTVTEPN